MLLHLNMTNGWPIKIQLKKTCLTCLNLNCSTTNPICSRSPKLIQNYLNRTPRHSEEENPCSYIRSNKSVVSFIWCQFQNSSLSQGHAALVFYVTFLSRMLQNKNKFHMTKNRYNSNRNKRLCFLQLFSFHLIITIN